jgi:hypothetical protein
LNSLFSNIEFKKYSHEIFYIISAMDFILYHTQRYDNTNIHKVFETKIRKLLQILQVILQ